jgi:hypothetical protein
MRSIFCITVPTYGLPFLYLFFLETPVAVLWSVVTSYLISLYDNLSLGYIYCQARTDT